MHLLIHYKRSKLHRSSVWFAPNHYHSPWFIYFFCFFHPCGFNFAPQPSLSLTGVVLLWLNPPTQGQFGLFYLGLVFYNKKRLRLYITECHIFINIYTLFTHSTHTHTLLNIKSKRVFSRMVNCSCGRRAVIRTSWTNINPGRRFYSCPIKVIS